MKCIECFDEHICIMVALSMWLVNSYHEFLFMLASWLMLSWHVAAAQKKVVALLKIRTEWLTSRKSDWLCSASGSQAVPKCPEIRGCKRVIPGYFCSDGPILETEFIHASILLLQSLMIFGRARLKSNGLFSCGCAGFSASLLLQVDSTVKTFLSKIGCFCVV